MILLQRTANVTNSVQTYTVSGKTACGFSLNLDVCVCFDNEINDLPETEVIEELSKNKFEKSWGVKVQTIEVNRSKKIDMEFADCDCQKMIESTVKYYASQESDFALEGAMDMEGAVA